LRTLQAIKKIPTLISYFNFNHQFIHHLNQSIYLSFDE
jgi:hypothetical protein